MTSRKELTLITNVVGGTLFKGVNVHKTTSVQHKKKETFAGSKKDMGF